MCRTPRGSAHVRARRPKGMKVSEALLKRLAQLSETDRTVLSAYIDLRHGWDEANHFVIRESQRLMPLLTSEEQKHVQTSISFLLDYLAQTEAQGFAGQGLAFFADLGADFTQGVELAVAPEPLLAIDEEAIIHPLALQLDEYEPIGVIMLDAFCVRILIAAGQTVEDINSMCKKIHHLSKAGGWSQMRYQRRRAKEVQHRVKDVVVKAIEIFNEASVNRIIIAGRDRMIASLEDEFPKEWRDKVIATVRWDLDAPEREFLQKIRPFLEEAERNEETQLLHRLLAELRRNGLAVAGVEATTEALHMGQVDTLLISGALDFDASERLTSLAEASGAHVEFVPPENETLRGLGGAGAILRYKVRVS